MLEDRHRHSLALLQFTADKQGANRTRTSTPSERMEAEEALYGHPAILGRQEPDSEVDQRLSRMLRRSILDTHMVAKIRTKSGKYRYLLPYDLRWRNEVHGEEAEIVEWVGMDLPTFTRFYKGRLFDE